MDSNALLLGSKVGKNPWVQGLQQGGLTSFVKGFFCLYTSTPRPAFVIAMVFIGHKVNKGVNVCFDLTDSIVKSQV